MVGRVELSRAVVLAVLLGLMLMLELASAQKGKEEATTTTMEPNTTTAMPTKSSKNGGEAIGGLTVALVSVILGLLAPIFC